tara:strand:- start:700 stop:1926 length:1227 start_codon:yes stop_codon:yes gene_type:complete
MEKKKNTIADEALMDIEVIRAALTENAKEILRAVTREEIDGVIKESLNEEDFEEDEVDADGVDVLEVPEEGEEGAEDSEEINADSEGEEGDDMEITDVEIETPESEEDSENMDDVELAIPDVDVDYDSEEIDLTDASDDMVIAVYKELSGEDEIEVVGNDIHLSVSEPGEYILKSKGASVEMDTDEVEMDTMALEGGMYNEGDDCDEEVVYEVYMDEEEFMTEDATEDCEDEDALEESIPKGSGEAHRGPGKAKIGQPLGAGADNLKESKTSEYEKLMSEANKLKKENELFKKNLSTFRKMLAENAVYNSNLTNVTRLFLEHATTKDEKKSIIKRFDDEVKTIKESKALYKRIVGELASAPSLTESVNVVNKTMTSGSSNLNSQTAYVDIETSRIKELMERVEGRKLL